MPLIEPEPPTTRPRGTGIERPAMPGCGTVAKRQLVASRPIAAATKLGMWMNGWLSCPPASMHAGRRAGILAQPRRHAGPRRARPDDDKIEFRSVHSCSPARSLRGGR